MRIFSVYSFYNGHFRVATDHVAVEFICGRLSVIRYKELPKSCRRTRVGVFPVKMGLASCVDISSFS